MLVLCFCNAALALSSTAISGNNVDYMNAISKIDQCSTTSKPSDDLYDAVRYIDKNAWKIYKDDKSKDELYERAYGSWKLVLATGGGKFTTFKEVPIFAFAMVDEKNFGNGVGFNENSIILSLLGPHIFNNKKQMTICIDDIHIAGKKVTSFVPDFMKDGIGVGKRPEDYKESGGRAPAFTFIAASGKSLVARGGSGGIAIWTRLENDIRPSAYDT